MPAADSTRFLVQTLINVFVCGQAKKKIAKIATKKQGKRTLKSYQIFLIFAITLIGLNQAVYFFFKPRNLYQQLNIPRSMPPNQIKQYQDNLKIKIMQMEAMPMKQKVENIKKIQSIVQVLIHPARRLSYDTFGETDTSYAWAFKNHYFLLSTIIGASVFYIICTFLNMVSDKNGQIKQVFKLEIMAMILLFLWQVQLIMRTQNRIHQHSDAVDNFYTAFPIFQRRQMMKIILIPSMNIIKFFYHFYVQSQTEKKFNKIGKNVNLRELTKKISEQVAKIHQDQHLQDKISVIIKQSQKKEPNKGNIYFLQRRLLQLIILSEGENIFMDQEVGMVLKYFSIKYIVN